MIASAGHGFRCFGTDWRSDIDLELFDRTRSTVDGTAIQVRLATTLRDRRLCRISPRMELAGDGFRMRWQDKAICDVYADGVIDVVPGDLWRGTVPIAFYSTVAGTLLAWRGSLPMHMSSVVVDDRAWLIGGDGGAGKSSLAAELIGQGAQFLADDLTVLHSQAGRLLATRGRPSMRLYPQIAERIDHEPVPTIADDDRGKRVILPRRRAADDSYEIGGIVILGPDAHGPVSGPRKLQLLAQSVFRPRIVYQTPAVTTVRRQLLDLANVQQVTALPGASAHGALPDAARAAQLFAAMMQAGRAQR